MLWTARRALWLPTLSRRSGRVQDAQELLKEAREARKPELLITDGLQSYHKAFNKEFYDHHQESEHVVAEGLTARSNNNKVERLHNTVRGWVKVMRGLHSDKSAAVFNEGFKVYYNFVRPNQALNGKTPAEVVGVDLKLGENKWLELVKKAMENVKG
jgi:putative transposase